MTATRTLIGYGRVSHVGKRVGDSYLSPSLQRERVEYGARSKGYALAGFVKDEDESGDNYARAAFQEVLERVESGEVAGIIVAKFDRFARSVLDAKIALERIHKAGGILISVDEGIDTSPANPFGKFATTMLFALAELELDRYKAGWNAVRIHTVAAGKWPNANPPTGYMLGEGRRLIVDRRDAETVREVFRGRATGAAWTALARLLEARMVISPAQRAKGGKEPHWTAAAVQALVRNRVYLGELRIGDEVNISAHPAVVTTAEFEAAQAARGESTPRGADGGALLSGLLRCSSCRNLLRPTTLSNGERVYVCRRRHASGECARPVKVSGKVIEPYIESVLLDGLPAGLAGRAIEDTAALTLAERLLADAEQELDAYVVAESAFERRETFELGLRARQEKVAEATQARRALFVDAASPLPAPTELRALWPELAIADRRRLIAAAIDTVAVLPASPDSHLRPVARTRIFWRGGAPGGLPRRGRTVALRGFTVDELERDAGMALA